MAFLERWFSGNWKVTLQVGSFLFEKWIQNVCFMIFFLILAFPLCTERLWDNPWTTYSFKIEFYTNQAFPQSSLLAQHSMSMVPIPWLIGIGKNSTSIQMNKVWEFSLTLEVHILAAFILLIKTGTDQVLTVSWDWEGVLGCNDCCL